MSYSKNSNHKTHFQIIFKSKSTKPFGVQRLFQRVNKFRSDFKNNFMVSDKTIKLGNYILSHVS